MNQSQRYLSFLLRLWQTNDGEKQVWRASLECPGSGQRHGFASFQELIDFLEAQIGQDEAEGKMRPSRLSESGLVGS